MLGSLKLVKIYNNGICRNMRKRKIVIEAVQLKDSTKFSNSTIFSFDKWLQTLGN